MEKLLNHEKYSYLTESAKEYILKNLKYIVVQDPDVERNPAILFLNAHDYEEVRKLLYDDPN